MKNIFSLPSFQCQNSPQCNLGLRSTVVSSHKKPDDFLPGFIF
jgi:hypothetical protein